MIADGIVEHCDGQGVLVVEWDAYPFGHLLGLAWLILTAHPGVKAALTLLSRLFKRLVTGISVVSA